MLENELRLKNIDLKNAETTISTLKESVEKEKETVQLLEEKVELAESEVYKTWERVKKEKAKDSDTINYLRDAEKRSSDASISMERKLVVANRKAKNNEKENIDVLNKLEELEKTNKKLIDKVRALEIVEANFEALKTDLDDIKHSEKVTKHVSTAYSRSDSKFCSKSSPAKEKCFPPFAPDSKLRNDINRNSLFPPFSSNINVFGLHHSEEACDSMTAIEQDDGTNFGKNDSGPDPGGS